MADFKIAMAKTAPFEGGWNHVKGDNGGETYKGIARKFYPDWAGWAIIDSHKPLKHNTIIKDERLDNLVDEFYITKKWLKLGGIAIQAVANQIFDFTVNSGRGAKIVQGLLGVAQDGIIGAKTIEAINRAGIALNEDIKQARIKYLTGLVEKDPQQEKFLKGWLRRANSF